MNLSLCIKSIPILFILKSVLVICFSPEMCQFYLSCLILWHKIVCNSPFIVFLISVSKSDTPFFIPGFGNSEPLFLGSLYKVFSILLIFFKELTNFWIHLFYSFLFPPSLISAPKFTCVC